MKPILVRCILLGAVLCAACQDGPEADEEAPGEDQPIDLFAPEGESLRLAKEPILVVGLEESLPLDRVRGAVFFGDGIAIANSGSSEILIVDSAGRLVSRRGGKGDGPGGYRYLDSFARHKDGLIAFDGGHVLLTVLDSTAECVSGTDVARAGGVALRNGGGGWRRGREGGGGGMGRADIGVELVSLVTQAG